MAKEKKVVEQKSRSQVEKEEIAALPEKYRPIGGWVVFALDLLFSVPVVGLIFLIIFSVNDKNIMRRGVARGFLFYHLIEIVLIILVIVLYAVKFKALVS